MDFIAMDVLNTEFKVKSCRLSRYKQVIKRNVSASVATRWLKEML